MPPQHAVTVSAQIKPAEMESLEQLLKAMGTDAGNNDVLPFARLPDTHFARLVILKEAIDLSGGRLAPRLLLMSDFDGEVEPYLSHLVEAAGAGLDQIFCHCEGYPETNTAAPGLRLAYLRGHMLDAAATYANTIGRTVQQIRQEAQLREAIEDFLDCSWQNGLDRDPLAVRAAIQKFVDGEPGLRWAKEPPERPGLDWRLREGLHLVGVPLLLLLLSPVILLGLPVYLILLRLREKTDEAPDILPDEAHLQALTELEDHVVQNQFTAIGFIKPGWFRLFTANAVLFLINYATRHIFNHANLAGVKTIHFARWVFLDARKRVLFASNYDGSVEAYNDDFIDKVAWGLNAVFSNGVGYPKTDWLVLRGAWDELAFKHYIRTHQIPSQVWYTAYDNLTALNIENNAQIRLGLYRPMDRAGVEAWLRRL